MAVAGEASASTGEDVIRNAQEDCPERKVLVSESKWVKPDLGKKKRRYVRM